MHGLIILLLAAAASALVIRAMIAAAPKIGLIDKPGEHKQHEQATPFVGGFGVFVSLLLAAFGLLVLYPEQWLAWASLATCAVVMFGVGLADDCWQLSAKIRLVVQAGLALVMVFGAGVVLQDLGNLFFMGPVLLGLLAVPFTVFAAAGGINALNMVDGIDGLSGSISAGTIALVAVLAWGAQDGAVLLLAMALLGGVAGFLWFNLRFGQQHRARVFMGDNGSMLLGFMIVWLLIDLTQGSNAIVSPVVALWLYAVPLLDTLSVMTRRIWLGKSPLSPDRNHLHHLLQRAGFRVEDTVLFISLLHLSLGGVGVTASLLGAPDGALLLGFGMVFCVYLLLTARPWRFVPLLRRVHHALRLTPAKNCGVFFSNCAPEHVQQLNAIIASQILHGQSIFRTRLYQRTGALRQDGERHAVVEFLLDDDADSVAPLRAQHHYLKLIKHALRTEERMTVRGYVQRDSAHDRRVANHVVAESQRQSDRRQGTSILLEESYTYVRNGRIVDQQVRHSSSGVTRVKAALQSDTELIHS